MRSKNFDIQRLIECLNNTRVETIQEALDDCFPNMKDEELTDEDRKVIDTYLFKCSECGFWCPSSEQSEDGVCDDCKENLYGDERDEDDCEGEYDEEATDGVSEEKEEDDN